jgi:hypothetical protein
VRQVLHHHALDTRTRELVELRGDLVDGPDDARAALTREPVREALAPPSEDLTSPLLDFGVVCAHDAHRHE